MRNAFLNTNLWEMCDWLLDHGVPVGSEEVPCQFVAMWVLADSHDHIWEVLSLHHFTQEALLHHPADRKETKVRGTAGDMTSVFPLTSIYSPLELVLQVADGHGSFHAALDGHLHWSAVLLKQEVPPLWCSSSNHEHSHCDVNWKAKNRQDNL